MAHNAGNQRRRYGVRWIDTLDASSRERIPALCVCGGLSGTQTHKVARCLHVTSSSIYKAHPQAKNALIQVELAKCTLVVVPGYRELNTSLAVWWKMKQPFDMELIIGSIRFTTIIDVYGTDLYRFYTYVS